MRAGDADRERLVEQFREQHAAGRLTLDEFDERMPGAYAAKTYGELRTLTRTLPVDLAQLNFQQAQERTRCVCRRARRGPPRRSGRTADFYSQPAIQDRLNAHLDRHTQRWQHHQQRREDRWARQQERWKQQAARRRGRGWASSGSWLSLAWRRSWHLLVSNLAGGGDWGDFWPAWPIGIMGVLMVAGGINRRK